MLREEQDKTKRADEAYKGILVHTTRDERAITHNRCNSFPVLSASNPYLLMVSISYEPRNENKRP